MTGALRTAWSFLVGLLPGRGDPTGLEARIERSAQRLTDRMNRVFAKAEAEEKAIADRATAGAAHAERVARTAADRAAGFRRVLEKLG